MRGPRAGTLAASAAVKKIVRDGYNRASYVYRPDASGADAFAHTEAEHRAWLAPLFARLRPGSRVLDLGCGCGVPDAALLATRYRVLGVDLSEVQVRRARALVPGARFRRADLTELRFPRGTFGAVLAFYSTIHVPLREQRPLFRRIHAWLASGGLLLATVGARAWRATEDDWLGSGARMYWSHAGAGTYARWFREAGFVTLERRFVPEGNTGHELFVLEKPRREPGAALRGTSARGGRARSSSRGAAARGRASSRGRRRRGTSSAARPRSRPPPPRPRRAPRAPTTRP